MRLWLSLTTLLLAVALTPLPLRAQKQREEPLAERHERARAMIAAGQLNEGYALWEEVLTLAEQRGDWAQAYWTQWQLARRDRDMGDFPKAEIRLRQALQLAQRAIASKEQRGGSIRLHSANAVLIQIEIVQLLENLGRRGAAWLELPAAQRALSAYQSNYVRASLLTRGSGAEAAIALQLNAILARFAIDRGEAAATIALIDRWLLELSQGAPRPETRTGEQRLLELLGTAYSDLAQPSRARAAFDQALRLGTTETDRITIQVRKVEQQLKLDGDLNSAIQTLNTLLERTQLEVLPDASVVVRMALAPLLERASQGPQAELHYQILLDQASVRRAPQTLVRARLLRAQGRLLRGEKQGIEADLLAALEQARRSGDLREELALLPTLAEWFERSQQWTAALAQYDLATRLQLGLDRANGTTRLLGDHTRLLDRLQAPLQAARTIAKIETFLHNRPTLAPEERVEAEMIRLNYLQRTGQPGRAETLHRNLRTYIESVPLAANSRDAVLRFNPLAPPSSTTAPAMPITKATAKTQSTLLHPREINSPAAPRQRLSATFHLHHPSTVPATLPLTVSGVPIMDVDVREDRREIDIYLGDSPRSQPQRSIPITLEAFDQWTIRAHAQIESEVALGKLTLSLPEPIQTSHWQWDTAQPVQQAGWHLNTSSLSAYLPAVLSQTLVFAETTQVEVPVRLRSSQPCRLTILDGATGRLLMVDEQGNNSLLDEGDLLLIPDGQPPRLQLDKNRIGTLEVWVAPATGSSLPSELTLTVEAQIGNTWKPCAIWHLKPRSS